MERRAIPGWEGYYDVTTEGHVFSCARTVVDHRGRPRYLPSRQRTPSPDAAGYLCVPLYRGNHATGARVHRLVALTFIGPPPSDQHEVRHLDGDKTNNGLENLAWGTSAENHEDMMRHGTWKQPPTRRGTDIERSRVNEDQVREIRARYAEGARQVDLAERFGICQTAISSIVRRKTWAHVV